MTENESGNPHDARGAPEQREDAAAMLALLESERARAASALVPDPRIVYGVWGAAWLVGFLGLWAGQGRSRDGAPFGVTAVLFTACLLGAGLVTGVHSSRRSAGVSGASARVGAWYGWSWAFAFLALTAIMNGLGLHGGLTYDLAGLLWSVLSGLVVGTFYTASGAFGQDRAQFALGAWILLVSGAGSLAGLPYAYLVMGLAGGGGFLGAAAWFAVRPPSPARRPAARA